MDNATLALLLTVVVHLIGVAALLWALLDRDDPAEWRGWWRGDGGPDAPIAPRPAGPRGDVPLPDAAPSRVRLREPTRIAEGYDRPERRPAHVPAPERAPDRVAG